MGSIKKALCIAIPVLILAGIIIPLVSISLLREEAGEVRGISFSSPTPEVSPPSPFPDEKKPSPGQKWAEMLSQTQEAYGEIAPELPRDEPTFSVDFIGEMFVVEVRAASWEDYAKIRREATFFRDRGLDPCKLYIAWVAPKDLMQIPPPAGLDYGCGLIEGVK